MLDVTNPELHQQVSGIDRIFIAPEIINGDTTVTEKADIWTLGVILYILIIGGIQHNSSDNIEFDLYETKASDELMNFVNDCLNPN